MNNIDKKELMKLTKKEIIEKLDEVINTSLAYLRSEKTSLESELNSVKKTLELNGSYAKTLQDELIDIHKEYKELHNTNTKLKFEKDYLENKVKELYAELFVKDTEIEKIKGDK